MTLAAPAARRTTKVRLIWAGGTHDFRLVFGQPEPSRYAVGVPAAPVRVGDHERAVLGRLLNDTWGADDLVNTIRAGLIGGGGFRPTYDPLVGNTWPDVANLVREHVAERPLVESVSLATAILVSAVFGNAPELAGMAVDLAAYAEAANLALADSVAG
jgi:hypothetical protein